MSTPQKSVKYKAMRRSLDVTVDLACLAGGQVPLALAHQWNTLRSPV